MDFARFNRPNYKAFDNDSWSSKNHLDLVVKFPNTRILRLISYSLFSAMVILTLPCIVSILGRESGSEFFSVSDTVDSEQLDLFLRGLGHEGLAINGQKALILSSAGTKGLTQIRMLDGDEHKLEIVVDSNFDSSGLFSDDSFDFVFFRGLVDFDFMDRILKIGGIVAFPLNNNDPSNQFQNKPNYRTVFLNGYSSIIMAMQKTAMSDQLVYASASRRRLSSIIMAMQKTAMSDQLVYASASRRRLCQFSSPTRNVALRNLEDLPLEPPIKDVPKPNKLGRQIKLLPNLVTVGVREENRDMKPEKFDQNYPRKDQEFEKPKESSI